MSGHNMTRSSAQDEAIKLLNGLIDLAINPKKAKEELKRLTDAREALIDDIELSGKVKTLAGEKKKLESEIEKLTGKVDSSMADINKARNELEADRKMFGEQCQKAMAEIKAKEDAAAKTESDCKSAMKDVKAKQVELAKLIDSNKKALEESEKLKQEYQKKLEALKASVNQLEGM